MPMGQHLKDAVLTVVKGTDLTHLANLYVALFTANPTDADNSGTECVGTGYARVAVASGGWSAISGTTPRLITNSAKIDFGSAGAGDWGTLIGVALVSSASGAWNNWFYKPSAFSKVVNSGDPVYFDIGELEIDMS